MDLNANTSTAANVASTSNAVASPPAPVSWQTILWTTLPLLLNIWAQKTGSVLSLPLQYSRLARCFPFIALLDSIVLLLDVLYHSLVIRIHHRLQASLILAARISRIPSYDSAYPGFTSKENAQMSGFRGEQWTRWLLFALGTALPAIKLMSLKGVPWTKAVGICWLLSWILEEFTVLYLYELTQPDILEFILARRDESLAPAIIESMPEEDRQFWEELRQSWESELGELTTNHLWLGSGSLRCPIECGIACLAATVHVFLSLWMLQDLAFTGLKLQSSFQTSTAEVVIMVWCWLVGYLLSDANMISTTLNRSKIRGITSKVDARVVLAVTTLLVAAVLLRSWYAPRAMWLLLLHAVLYLSTGGIFWMTEMLAMSRLFKYLYWRAANDIEYAWVYDTRAEFHIPFRIAWLLLFNFILCVLWYAYRYDSTGTINPLWTSAFG